MSIAEIITLAALVAGMLGMGISLRRQSAAGINVKRLTNRQQDTEEELLTLRSKVERLETLLTEKEEMLRVVTKEVITIQRKLLDAENKLTAIGDDHGDCRQELAIAKHQVEALQTTVEKQALDLKAMDEIEREADQSMRQVIQLKRRVEELLAGGK